MTISRRKVETVNAPLLPGFEETLSGEPSFKKKQSNVRGIKFKKWHPIQVTSDQRIASWKDWHILHAMMRRVDSVSTVVVSEKSLDALPSASTMSQDRAQRMVDAFPAQFRKHRRP